MPVDRIATSYPQREKKGADENMMTYAQLKHARQALGLTRAQMALVLDLPGESVMADKERGCLPVTHRDEVMIIAYLHGYRPPGLFSPKNPEPVCVEDRASFRPARKIASDGRQPSPHSVNVRPKLEC